MEGGEAPARVHSSIFAHLRGPRIHRGGGGGSFADKFCLLGDNGGTRGICEYFLPRAAWTDVAQETCTYSLCSVREILHPERGYHGIVDHILVFSPCPTCLMRNRHRLSMLRLLCCYRNRFRISTPHVDPAGRSSQTTRRFNNAKNLNRKCTPGHPPPGDAAGQADAAPRGSERGWRGQGGPDAGRAAARAAEGGVRPQGDQVRR